MSIKCPCGACEATPIQFETDVTPRGYIWSYPGVGIARWSRPDLNQDGVKLGYCPKCGARLSFATDGTPQAGERAAVVEGRAWDGC